MITFAEFVGKSSTYTGIELAATLKEALPSDIHIIRFAKIKEGTNLDVLMFRKGEEKPASHISCSKPLSKKLKEVIARGVPMNKILGSLLGCPVHELTTAKGEKYNAIVAPADFAVNAGLEISNASVVSWESLAAL